MKTKFVMLAAMVCLTVCCRGLRASIITIEISGHVTAAGGSGLPATIYEDVPFTGSYTYDSLATDSDPDPLFGAYQYDSPYGISIVMGGHEFRTSPIHSGQFSVVITNDFVLNICHDFYEILSTQNASLSDGSSVDEIYWSLNDNSHSAFSSTALPTLPPILTQWDDNVLRIHGEDSLGNSFHISAIVTHAVPEPFAVSLMATGFFLYRRRR